MIDDEVFPSRLSLLRRVLCSRMYISHGPPGPNVKDITETVIFSADHVNARFWPG